MRAKRAYITSLGTTGLLIASALLTLTVMSAFVAFTGFPGQKVQDPIGTVLVQERQAAVKVPAHPVHASARGASRTSAPATAHRVAAPRHTHAPVAHARPVSQTTPATQPQSGQTPTSSSQQQPSASDPLQQPTGTATQELPPTPAPSLPSSQPLPLPVSVPSLPSSPSSSQLPLDTSGVTNLLGSP